MLYVRSPLSLRNVEDLLHERGIDICQETGQHLNNRAENSHLPFRRRERAMSRFRCMRSLQKFASIHSSVYNHFDFEGASTPEFDSNR
nr:DDE-type integrase/transposase/recombinase [Hyphomonas beringensis]